MRYYDLEGLTAYEAIATYWLSRHDGQSNLSFIVADYGVWFAVDVCNRYHKHDSSEPSVHIAYNLSIIVDCIVQTAELYALYDEPVMHSLSQTPLLQTASYQLPIIDRLCTHVSVHMSVHMSVHTS